jgi:hypothetical protein
VHSLERDDTITAGCYSGTFDRLWHATSHKRPGWLCLDIIILHNNARPHTANLTCDWLQCYSWEVTDLRPYTLISHPVISISLDPLRGILLAICNRHQCEASCHLLATPQTIYLLSWDCALVPWWSKCFVNSDTLRSCMHHLPLKCSYTSVSVCIHQSVSVYISQNKAVSIRTFIALSAKLFFTFLLNIHRH